MITLKTLGKASAQEVFNQVKTHLLTQNEKCMVSENCAYKSGTLKCAAGCLIADDEYSPKFEGISWSAFPEEFSISSNHLKLIKQLQIVHDWHIVKDWPIELEKVANTFNLKY